MNLGDRIRYYRNKEKLSQESLAEKIGVTRQAVTSWETNRSSPTTDNLIKITSIFNISMEDLISDKSVRKIDKKKEIYNKGMIISISLSGVAAAFFYGSSRIENTGLRIVYTILACIGSILMIIFSKLSYDDIKYRKILRNNLIYLILINIFGILNKFYGGIISFIIIILITYKYAKYIEKINIEK